MADVRGIARHPVVMSTIVSILTMLTLGIPLAGRILGPWLITITREAVSADTNAIVNKRIEPLIISQQKNIESKIAELDDSVKLETFRKQAAISKWTALDELKLSQLERRLQQERDNWKSLNQLIHQTPKTQ